jgi:excisionase family DNA binding protein
MQGQLITATAPRKSGSVRRVRYSSLTGLIAMQEQQATQLLSQRMFSVTEFATAMGTNQNTIRSWIRRGDLLGLRTGRAGHFRIPAGELARLKGASDGR